MEKPTNEERNLEVDEHDVKNMTLEQQQAGIDANLQAMVEQFTQRLIVLQELTGRTIDVRANGKLKDGRKIHIRVR